MFFVPLCGYFSIPFGGEYTIADGITPAISAHSSAKMPHLFASPWLLGLAWNVGAFGAYGLFNLGFAQPSPLVLAAAFSSLCFLPGGLSTHTTKNHFQV